MTDSVSGSRPRRVTARGAATKARIVEAADQLMYERGVVSTTLSDVRAASGTSKSQLYQHFAEKSDLVSAVIEVRADAVLSQQRRRLNRIESFRGLELWRDELVERNAIRNGAFGCPLGALANEIADHDGDTRKAIAAHFDAWLQLLIDAIDELKARDQLTARADSHALATGLLAALQGGYLLAKTARDVRPMRVALDMAISQVRVYSTETTPAEQ
ncbi:TetR/AcrR family transcriptional regulator [Rhodococcus ruber]|uniref:TetR/AcrR family transcriptional regulator n=1 Tax=Rhodococcus ruber TaxID=1830 RepID=A0ABT4MMT8_9NOCA|nr:TetR/AcrR family transcriptional regulator [Rhodococcus ruber]MCZ4521056.1 TetR/AcrR family transcriptional regulator [Rhodococcus ruber]